MQCVCMFMCDCDEWLCTGVTERRVAEGLLDTSPFLKLNVKYDQYTASTSEATWNNLQTNQFKDQSISPCLSPVEPKSNPTLTQKYWYGTLGLHLCNIRAKCALWMYEYIMMEWFLTVYFFCGLSQILWSVYFYFENLTLYLKAALYCLLVVSQRPTAVKMTLDITWRFYVWSVWQSCTSESFLFTVIEGGLFKCNNYLKV